MQLNRVRMAIEKTRNMLATTGPILKGSVSAVMLGKRKRKRGTRVAYLFTYKGDENRTSSMYVKKSQVAEVKTMIRNYQKLKTTLNKLAELHVKLFKYQQMTKRLNTP